ncbi:PEP-CTERM sorting domain-containing protein [uncultured Thiohalocapsa sp.]|uniref:PEP-CTERM sorting domain-containing protein n=1 Tax=uncultured Thiohalocapsa sp. TaxID=768990 RepID=UPI0025F2A8E4|nr:PEP-CTERM sorting domain-containing protein [uncultured Thiohalocapsa sp.]
MTESTTLDTQLDAYSRRATRRGTRKPSTSEVLGYTAAAGGLAFAGGDALGAIVHNTTSVSFSVSDDGGTFSFDIDGVGGDDLQLYLFAFANSAGASHLNGGLGATVATNNTGNNPAINLAPGFVVGTTLASGSFNDNTAYWYRNFGTVTGPFSNNSTGYLGLRFDGDTGTVGTQYAWVKVRFDFAAPKLTMNILEWAYDNSGAPICVGDTGSGCGGTPVPVPGTPLLTLLGLGAMGLSAYRRRREEGLQRLAEEQDAAAA